MIPIRDDNPTFMTPWATLLIVSLNVAVWVLLQGMGTEPTLTGSICRFGLIPGELMQQLPAGTRLPFGTNMVCVMTDQPAWYTPLTSMFMHGGWLHIIGNMWFLWIFGNNVEDAMGHVRFIAFYLLCGLGAAASQVLADPGSAVPMVGASGAIGGVMGAYILLYPRVHVHMLIIIIVFVTTIAVPAYLMLGYWFLLQILSGWASSDAQGGGVAFWAHTGGFIVGGLLTFVFRDRELLARHPFHGWRRNSTSTRSWRRIDR